MAIITMYYRDLGSRNGGGLLVCINNNIVCIAHNKTPDGKKKSCYISKSS